MLVHANRLLEFKAAPADEIVRIDDIEFVRPSDFRRLLDSDYISNHIASTRGDRINFWSESLDKVVSSFGEPSNSTYSWFVLVEDKSETQKRPTPSDPIVPEILHYSDISEETRSYLRAMWLDDYIKKVVSQYPSTIIEDLISSHDTTMNEGTHFIYKRGNQIIAHGAQVEDHHEILGIDDQYLHIWVDQSQERDLRSAIHNDYFSRIRALPTPGMVGVSAINKKSLRLFTKNNFMPVLLSVGIYR